MVRGFSVLILVLLGAGTIRAQGRVQALVKGFQSNKGICRACLFNNAEAFSSGKGPLQCLQVAVANKEARLQFEPVPAGRYAVALFHDANENNQLDKNFLGIPKEGYGASRNNLPFAAAPSFEENAFEVAASTVQLQVKLRYIGR
jgi:uncharacterized protein (DUF2141 family)